MGTFRRWLVIASLGLLVVLVGLALLQQRAPRPIALTPTLTGQVEYCLTCHSTLEEISKSHPVKVFGCVRCHGGERLALDANLAHSTLRPGPVGNSPGSAANPSDLSVVQESCGGNECHDGSALAQRDHIQRVRTSIQSTYAGAIAQIRRAFGAQPDLIARYAVVAVRANPDASAGVRDGLAAFDPSHETSPALQTFAANCLNCHLNAGPPPGEAYSRFSGCAACHTPTQPGGNQSPIHRLTTAMPYSQCNTCHNRGNYDVRSMHFNPRRDNPSDRLHDYYQPIAQFTRCEWTLDCIDCHTRQEAMGDGNLYSNKRDIQYIQCRTCHGTLTEIPATTNILDNSTLALRLAQLNPVVNLKVGDRILVTNKDEPLWNTRQMDDGTLVLFTKVTRQKLTIPLVKGSACQQRADQQASSYCEPCHAVQK